jgi:fatty-acyl-CoA synthase
MGIKGDLAIWEAESFGVEPVNMTLGELLDARADALPDVEALVYNYPELGITLRLTYSQYRAEVNLLARGLLALGIQPGDHIAVWAPNLPEWVLLELALAKIGAVLVTVNTAYRTAELEYVLRQGDIATLFMTRGYRGNSYLDSIYSIAPELKTVDDPVKGELSSAALPRLKRVAVIDDWQRATAPEPGLLRYEQVLALADTVPDDIHQRDNGLSERRDAHA